MSEEPLKLISQTLGGHARMANATAAERQAFAASGQEGLREKYRREARDKHPGWSDADIEASAYHLHQAHLLRARLAAAKAKRARKQASS